MPNPKSSKHTPSLSDKYDLTQQRLILTGSQAIVRLALMQAARDKAAGHRTAGYVTGYRGSPIAGIEGAFDRASPAIRAADIKFHPGLNEDLAATAIWGSQQAELRGEGKYEGVFAIWYGKGPGVDRSGDVFRHANHAGTSKLGGVLALMGDDHTCESSTSAHQSEYAFVDAMIPVLNPSGVQEIIDYGLYGFALSRFAGVWVGMKCVKDNIESTASVEGGLDRVQIKLPPDVVVPDGGLNIRLGDQPLAKEARLHDFKRDAIQGFVRANGLDKVIFRGGPAPKIGIVTCGKSYLDVRQALDELGIDEVKAAQLGLALYKVAVVYPMEPKGLIEFARNLDLVIVVEEKRALLEVQVREELYGLRPQPALIGKKDENGQWLFPAKGALEPSDIAIALGERLISFGAGSDIKAQVAVLKALKGNAPLAPDVLSRVPYFCAGCPHNTSTNVPQGSRAYAGIGCHYMAQWMDRATEGFTQMGGEGANWIGEAPFSKRGHIFQNLGDGTYLHSGSLAVRAALASDVNITFKILFNDAVAMTGGQKLDGGITAPKIARQLQAEGVRRIILVTDEPHKYQLGEVPSGVPVRHRRDLEEVQKSLSQEPGVTALIYDQTCAAEKRRRRKRGLFPDPNKRVYINPAVCEGCGDCGVKSNCVAILPLETDFGRKRRIDQSACNKDFSCVEGFCPSFVTVHGGKIARAASTAPAAEPSPERGQAEAQAAMLASLPEPEMKVDLTKRSQPFALLITGVGGTGVVTLSAILCEAAHIEGKGFAAIDMTGLAQKGGAVACHIKLARTPDDIHAIRVGHGGADLVLGGDLVVTGSAKVLDAMAPSRTNVVYSNYELTTGDFTRRRDLTVPAKLLIEKIAQHAQGGIIASLDAHKLAERLLGDAIAGNMLLLGYAWQLGLIPLGIEAISKAIELNGAQVKLNLQAFAYGRLAAHNKAALERLIERNSTTKADQAPTLSDVVETRARHLEAYQDRALADRYKAAVARMQSLEGQLMPGQQGLALAVARSYHKLLSFKDEYEVARLYASPDFMAGLGAELEGGTRLDFHLAPPFLGAFYKNRSTGHPRKIKLPGWLVMPIFKALAKAKALRGGAFDPFKHMAERKAERALISDYEAMLDEIAVGLSPSSYKAAVELASLPLEIKGFGHVKMASVAQAQALAAGLKRQLHVHVAKTPAPVAAE